MVRPIIYAFRNSDIEFLQDLTLTSLYLFSPVQIFNKSCLQLCLD